MESKWLNFLLMEQKSKTQVWRVENKKGGLFLGIIKWYPQWRQYTFFPMDLTVFAQSCLNDIVNFIKELMDKRK